MSDDLKALIERVRDAVKRIDRVGSNAPLWEREALDGLDALEAAQQAPAVDRGQLLLVLAGDDCYEHDADSDGWVFSPGRAVDSIIASGVLLDSADQWRKAFYAGERRMMEHQSFASHEQVDATRAQQVREGN